MWLSHPVAPILSRACLTADADLVYRALVCFGQSRSAAVARELRLSHGRVLTALSSLHSAGLVTTLGDGVRRSWLANTPHDQPPQHTAGPYPAQFAALAEVRRLGDDLHHLTSRPATQRRLDEIYGRSPKELLGINPEHTWDEAALKAAARSSHLIIASGMTVRELGTNPPEPDLLIPYGGLRMPVDTYRRLTGVPMKLIIFDRQVAFFPVDPGNVELGYLEVSQAPIVESLVAMFERQWAGAEKFAEKFAEKSVEEPMSGFQLSPREEAVVEQLVLGRTDATAARALHISERTVSTIVRSLMERLDVRNRFQLGVALGKLDAAPLPPPTGRGRGEDSGQRSETGT
jgi:DNA-binding CsgD family transcriptional regulator/predicted DNA-binding transcriptional regulator